MQHIVSLFNLFLFIKFFLCFDFGLKYHIYVLKRFHEIHLNRTITKKHFKTKANMNFYVCICFLAVINEKPPVAESSTSTFTKSPKEGAVVTTESDVSQSAAQEVASSIESEETSSEPIPEEPVFILSLTEIPPTVDEGAGFRTEPLPLTPVSELHSHGQRYAVL